MEPSTLARWRQSQGSWGFIIHNYVQHAGGSFRWLSIWQQKSTRDISTNHEQYVGRHCMCYGNHGWHNHSRKDGWRSRQSSQTSLAAITEWNQKLNLEKCKLLPSSIMYVGHIITDKCAQLDPEKVPRRALMLSPTSKEHVRWFLGSVTCLNKFFLKMSEIDKPLRDVIKNSDFNLNRPQV